MSKASPGYLMDVTCDSKNVRNGSAAEISILPRGRTRPGVRFRRGTLELAGYIRDAADAPADLCFSDDVNVAGKVNVTIARNSPPTIYVENPNS
ncbi:hypothetical protein [Stenotrophomonas bentonitica]